LSSSFDPGSLPFFVENFVDYFLERPEESSILYLVNMNQILIGTATLYLSTLKRNLN